MKAKTILSSKITLTLLVLLTVFLSWQKYVQIQQNKRIENEKKQIQEQINLLDKKNREIADSLEYFKSEGFKQRVAREQLNLKKPDEQIFVFRQEQNQITPKDTYVEPKKLSNLQKWLKYFSGQTY